MSQRRPKIQNPRVLQLFSRSGVGGHHIGVEAAFPGRGEELSAALVFTSHIESNGIHGYLISMAFTSKSHDFKFCIFKYFSPWIPYNSLNER